MQKNCLQECGKVFSLSEEAIKLLEDASKDTEKSCSEIIDELVALMFLPLFGHLPKVE